MRRVVNVEVQVSIGSNVKAWVERLNRCSDIEHQWRKASRYSSEDCGRVLAQKFKWSVEQGVKDFALKIRQARQRTQLKGIGLNLQVFVGRALNHHHEIAMADLNID